MARITVFQIVDVVSITITGSMYDKHDIANLVTAGNRPAICRCGAIGSATDL